MKNRLTYKPSIIMLAVVIHNNGNSEAIIDANNAIRLFVKRRMLWKKHQIAMVARIACAKTTNDPPLIPKNCPR